MTVGIINYGMGNIYSVVKAMEKVGSKVIEIRNPEALSLVDRVIFPGVGAFPDCVKALESSGLGEAIKQSITNGMPYLGICLGMHVLMEASHEFGNHIGFGFIKGVAKRFPNPSPDSGIKVPHMGWNEVIFLDKAHSVLNSLQGKECYYLHSYYCAPKGDCPLAICHHGATTFASIIGKDNILGVQFHPEKSQSTGLALLAAFAKWAP